MTKIAKSTKHQGKDRYDYTCQYTISAKYSTNIALTSNRHPNCNFNTLLHKNTQTESGPLIYYLCTAAPISSNWHQLQSTCILFLTESWARAFGADGEKAPQTTPTSNPHICPCVACCVQGSQGAEASHVYVFSVFISKLMITLVFVSKCRCSCERADS